MTEQLSRKQVEWLRDAATEFASTQMKMTMKPEEVLQLTTALLAGMDSKPVAKVETVGVCWYADNGVPRKPAVGAALYAAAPAPAPVSVPDEQHSERFEWSYEDWANHLGGRHQNNDPACYYEFGSFMAVAEMLRQFGNVQRKIGWNVCRAAMLKAEPVTAATVPEEKGSSLQLRNLIRKRHAEWSQKAFGNVGPVGPLKHLAKEAIEAAEAPHDLSEWADMQFLLWDAQRRAGISDAEITAAMEEKLKVNMARQWPEPKDGEPRLHIKPEQEV